MPAYPTYSTSFPHAGSIALPRLEVDTDDGLTDVELAHAEIARYIADLRSLDRDDLNRELYRHGLQIVEMQHNLDAHKHRASLLEEKIAQEEREIAELRKRLAEKENTDG